MRPVRRSCVAMLVLGLSACGEPSELEEASEPEPASGEARWVSPERPSDPSILEHPARTVATASAGGEIGAPFRARVLRVHVAPGAVVEAGDPVLDVVMPEVLDAAALVQGLGRRIPAHRARVEELERLSAEQLVDRARVFEQRTALAELEAERSRALAVLRAASLDAADAARVLRQGAITLRSPTDGVVRSLDAHLGETREPGGPPFARVVGVAAVRVEVRSPAALPQARALTFEGTEGTRFALDPEPIARVIDPEDGMHVTWLAPREPTALTDGLRGRVTLSLDEEELWEVPASAVLIETRGPTLLVRRGGEMQPIQVEVVSSSGASAIVRAPLVAGDLIASEPDAALESR